MNEKEDYMDICLITAKSRIKHFRQIDTDCCPSKKMERRAFPAALFPCVYYIPPSLLHVNTNT
jgi:hypothetical protein